MEIFIRLLCILIGYCLGLFQTAYIYGKLHGIDIRDYGSGNSGTTNALRVLGKKAGIIVFLGDFGKAVIACIIGRLIGFYFYPDMMYSLILWSGFGVILGHNFPCYMHFKGGKGIAATAGVILGILDWRIMVVCLVSFLVCIIITRYVSLGSLIVVTLFFAVFLALGMTGHLMNPVTMEAYTNKDLVESYIIIFMFGALAFYRHKANIIRLVHGEENKIFSKKPELNKEQ